MSEITLVSRELTFTDMEFQEADITSKDKLQNIINEVIEGGISDWILHVTQWSFFHGQATDLQRHTDRRLVS